VLPHFLAADGLLDQWRQSIIDDVDPATFAPSEDGGAHYFDLVADS
jgi:hypothetical protein